MWLHWQPTITFVNIGVACLVTGTLGQRVRVQEPNRSVVVDKETAVGGGDYHQQENATGEQAVVSEIPQVSEVPEISGIPQVDINLLNGTTTAGQPEPTEPVISIAALLFSGPPGPKNCRGTVITNVQLPKPGSQHSTPKCYNMPGIAQCGTFVANQDDGCQARLFNEPNCLTFANLAVFTPEQRAVGGLFRSIEITCGIKGETPPPLNLPGMKLPPGAQQAVGKVKRNTAFYRLKDGRLTNST
ncbi:uncharacterized protein GGS25DRAFT_240218 [Hypoxylon fragiforme]|uniref:uncharacterized protein n=1 Tax=Hypoxylon fragiforme TaxID=63214 RepID=UPI0020C5E6E1|nr:uncharacterized protein GGS25DRAFT_240218 [Hypoxylon fragiforme]KAI2609947.1 hypothetical protein GGS25DRAFT_240218 [Hypoxylon fragiforme]